MTTSSELSLTRMARRSTRVIILIIIALGCISIFGGFSISSSSRRQLEPFIHKDVKPPQPPSPPSPPSPEEQQNLKASVPQNERVVDNVGASSPDSEPPLIMKVTMLYGDRNEVYERALQSHIKHGDIHGYPVKVLRQKMLGRLWTKPAWLLSIVLDEMVKPPEERIEWIFWFDADTIIANPEVPLEIFLPPEPERENIHFLCGFDHHGLNDGAFLLRVNDYALHMLAASLSVESYRPDIDLKYSEQSAIEHVVLSGDAYRPWDNTRYIDGYAKIPQRWMNAYMGARDERGNIDKKKKSHANSILQGDLLLHFAGSGDTKRQRMSAFMDAWDKDSSMWRRPLGELKIEQEIANYWKDFTIAEVQPFKYRAEGVTVA